MGYAEHPERFVAGHPRVARPPARVLINPAQDQTTGEELLDTPADDLAALFTSTPQSCAVPVIHLAAATPSTRQQSIST
jgi:hypothetical protein